MSHNKIIWPYKSMSPRETIEIHFGEGDLGSTPALRMSDLALVDRAQQYAHTYGKLTGKKFETFRVVRGENAVILVITRRR